MSGVRLEQITVHFPRTVRFPGIGAAMAPAAPTDDDPLARLRSAGTPAVHADDDVTLEALRSVDLAVADGEAIALVGPSGCGKSTLLRVIAGLQPVASGRVFFDESDVTESAPKERGIGMVFQNYALYPHMESKGNLGFFFRVHHRSDEIDERVRITAQVLGVGFDALLDRKPKQLSGGQQQRVAIGRCIVREPKVFLFDEPLSNLDAKLRATTRVEIKRLLRRFAITTIYVTHDQVEAIALGDRIAVMRAGRIEQIGSFRDLYDRPVNVFVGAFLGAPAMNFLPATLSDDRAAVRLGPATIALAKPASSSAGSAVVVGFRPEHVRLAERDAGALPGRVEVVEPLLAERQQLLTLDLLGYRCTARLPASVPVAQDDLLPLTVSPEAIRLFDSETGMALS